MPFRGDSTAVIFDAILNRSPVSPVRLNPDLPPELERIINRALEKDRDLRYQHASEMRAELQRLKRNTDSSRRPAVAVAEPISSTSGVGTSVVAARGERQSSIRIGSLGRVTPASGMVASGSSSTGVSSVEAVPECCSATNF